MKIKSIQISRQTFFHGKRKIGLDSGVLISLIECEDCALLVRETKKIFKKINVVYTHWICMREVIQRLIKKYPDEYPDKAIAKKAVKEIMREYSINEFQVLIPTIQEVDDLVHYCKSKGINTHESDVLIILIFKKFGVNKIYSTDNNFLKACRLIGIDGTPFPTYERSINNQIRKIFGKGKFKGHRFHK